MICVNVSTQIILHVYLWKEILLHYTVDSFILIYCKVCELLTTELFNVRTSKI